MSKIFKDIRTKQKHDIESNWLKATGFIPLDGELIIYDVDETHIKPRFKVGNGKDNVNDLPFVETQPDWSQNDDTQPDYVKNRTHWSEVVEILPVEILPETTIATEEDLAAIPLLPLEDDNEYTVTWNGTEYNCTGIFAEENGMTAVMLGDVYTMSEGTIGTAATGEPFVIMAFSPETAATMGVNTQIQSLDGLTEFTVSISTVGGGFEEVVHHIDPKYIKDMYYTGIGLAELLPECSPTYDESEQSFMMELQDSSQLLEVGKEYVINWNGVEYTCIGQDSSALMPGTVVVGNGSALGSDSGLTGNNEPFLLVTGQENSTYLLIALPIDGSTELTLSIFGSGEVVHHLDPKYIKDMYYETTKKNIFKGSYTSADMQHLANGVYLVAPSGEKLFPLKISNSYVVTWNGVDYRCMAKEVQLMTGGTTVAIGNTGALSLFVNGENTDDPFIIFYTPAGETGIMCTDGITDISVSIVESYIHRIDEKYLPDTVATIEYVDTNISTAKSDMEEEMTEFQTSLEASLAASLNKKTEIKDITVLHSENEDFNSICYGFSSGSGRFVAAIYDNSNKCNYISDCTAGTHWSHTLVPIQSAMSKLCYGGGKFVALVGSNFSSVSTIAYSSNISSWTEVALPVSFNNFYCCEICYANDKFIIVGFLNNTLTTVYSEDGITWTAAEDTALTLEEISTGASTLCYGNGKLLFTNGNNLFYSMDDGATWASGGTLSLKPYSICYGKGKFVVVGSASDWGYYYSEDGIIWTECITSNHQSFSPHYTSKVCFVDDRFIIANSDGQFYYSKDGINWEWTSVPSAAASLTYIDAVVYGNNILLLADYHYGKIAYSKNLTVWTSKYIGQDFSDITHLVFNLINANEEADHVANGDTEIILTSSTEDSTKQFKITVNDSGNPIITDTEDSTNSWTPYTMDEIVESIPQSDWNQNDPTQPDYVKNRTHWVEPGGVTEILPETSLTYSEDMGGFVLVNALPLEVGAEYTVSWNGAEFVCVGQTFSEGELTGVVLGNIGLMTGGADTGEPFIILTLPPEAAAEMGIGTQIMPIDGSTEVTISIIGGKGDVYHKLDNNFLDLAWLPTIDVVENEVVPETTVTIGSALQLYSTDIAYSMIPEGTGTVVTWNGAKYNCTVKTVKVDGLGVYFYLGNIGMVSAELGANTGEPFVFAVMDINGEYGIAVSSSGDHVYSISTLDKVYNTIPEEFLGVDTSDVLEIDLYEMGMAEVVASSTVGYSFDTAEVLYALQTGKKVTVSFHLRINHISGGGTSTPRPKITLTGSGSGRLTAGYGTSIEELDYGVEAATFISVYLDNNGVRVTAYRLADLIDARTEDHVTNGNTEMILASSTEGSTKQFKVTVDDSGTLTATEIV